MEAKGIHLVFCEENEKSINIPHAMNKPSNFSIDHILTKAGNFSEKSKSNGIEPSSPTPKLITTQTTIDLSTKDRSFNDTTNSYLINNLDQYPPMLDWLQYTRYRPPRIPRKSA